jgi:hypothetical protein
MAVTGATPRTFRVASLVNAAAWLPALCPLWLIWQYGVDVPYWDEWYIASLVSRQDGPVSLAALLSPHSEHRILIPRLLFLANAWLTHWNLKYEMFTMWALGSVSAWCAWRLGGRQLPQPAAWVAAFLTAVFVFSPIQAESWLFGVQIAVFLPVACTFGGVLLASRRLPYGVKIAGCTTLALVSMWSHGDGLLTWIPICPVLIAAPEVSRRQRVAGVGLFAGACLVATAAYFHGLGLGHASIDTGLSRPLQTLRFALTYLGAPLAFGGPFPAARLAPLLALLELGLLAAAAAYVWQRKDPQLFQDALPWLALSVFPIGNSLLVAFARLPIGMPEALALRYLTVPIVLLVALTFLIGRLLADAEQTFGPRIGRSAGVGTRILVASALVLSAFSWRIGIAYARVLGAERLAAKAGVTFIDFDAASDLRSLSPLQVPELRRRAHALDEAGLLRPRLAISANVPAAPATGGAPGTATRSCGTLETGLRNPDGLLELEGWAVLPWRGRPADAVLLAFEDTAGHARMFAIAPVWLTRPDVSTTLGSRYRHAGWLRKLAPEEVPPDAKTVVAFAYDVDEDKACQLESRLELRR